jgi:hypothetical protein
MSRTTVTTQSELHDAIRACVEIIDVNSPPGEVITLYATGRSTVQAWGSSSLRLHWSACARLFDTARAEVHDNAAVWAADSATAERHSDGAFIRTYGSATEVPVGGATGICPKCCRTNGWHRMGCPRDYGAADAAYAIDANDA